MNISIPADPRYNDLSTICRNCHWDVTVHCEDGKCCFEASSYEPMRLQELVDLTMLVFKDDFDKHTHHIPGVQGPTAPHGH